jgi:hypothetical protein
MTSGKDEGTPFTGAAAHTCTPDCAGHHPVSAPCPEPAEEQVAMTVRFPRELHERLRKASYDTRIPINTQVNQGAVLRLAAMDETLARALADADSRNNYTWQFLSEPDRQLYRTQAATVLGLLGVTEPA